MTNVHFHFLSCQDPTSIDRYGCISLIEFRTRAGPNHINLAADDAIAICPFSLAIAQLARVVSPCSFGFHGPIR